MNGQKKDKKIFFKDDRDLFPTQFCRKYNMIIKKISKIRNGYLYEGNSNNKIELQLSYYDHCLSYVYVS